MTKRITLTTEVDGFQINHTRKTRETDEISTSGIVCTSERKRSLLRRISPVSQYISERAFTGAANVSRLFFARPIAQITRVRARRFILSFQRSGLLSRKNSIGSTDAFFLAQLKSERRLFHRSAPRLLFGPGFVFLRVALGLDRTTLVVQVRRNSRSFSLSLSFSLSPLFPFKYMLALFFLFFSKSSNIFISSVLSAIPLTACFTSSLFAPMSFLKSETLQNLLV